MFVVEFVFAFVISMLCAAVLLSVTARTGWRARPAGMAPLGVFSLLLLVFLATWAGGIWLVPFGPKLWGVAWATFVVVALFVVMLVGAVSNGDEAAPSQGPSNGLRSQVANLLALTLLVLLILALVAGYAWRA